MKKQYMIGWILDWETVLIVVAGIATIGLSVRAVHKAKEQELALDNERKENKRRSVLLIEKQNELSASQQDVLEKNKQIITLQQELALISKSIINEQKYNFDYIIGGNTHPMIVFAYEGLGEGRVVVTSEGKFPLYDVKVNILDLNGKEFTPNPSVDEIIGRWKSYQVNFISPGQAILAGTFKYQPKEENLFQMEITCRNGLFQQQHCVRYKNGERFTGYKIINASTKQVIYEYFDSGFLKDNEKEFNFEMLKSRHKK